MFDITIKNILANIWPMLVIITVILSSLRVVYIIRNKETFVLYREILKLGFVIYIMSLFYVVTFQDVSWSSSNFIPFKEMLRYRIFSNLFFKNVVGLDLESIWIFDSETLTISLRDPASILAK